MYVRRLQPIYNKMLTEEKISLYEKPNCFDILQSKGLELRMLWLPDTFTSFSKWSHIIFILKSLFFIPDCDGRGISTLCDVKKG